MSEAGAVEHSFSYPEVPEFVVVRTEDIDPERYCQLVLAVADLGLRTEPASYTRATAPVIAEAAPASPPRFATEPDLIDFATHHYYPDGLGLKTWRALTRADKVGFLTLDEVAQYPAVEFDARATGASSRAAALIRFLGNVAPGSSGPPRAGLDLESIGVLLTSIFADDRKRQQALIPNFGPRMQSFLADLINRRLHPDIPLPVAFEPDGSVYDAVRAPLPDAQTFEHDAASPHVDHATVQGEQVDVVTFGTLGRYGMTIGLSLYNIIDFRKLLAEMAYTIAPEFKDTQPGMVAERVHQDVYLLPHDPEVSLGDVLPMWGFSPSCFLDIMHRLETDEALRAAVPSYQPGLRPFITRYLNAIAKPPAGGPVVK
ncbi:MAG TPA: hypothetical protein VLF71_06170 [Candidatus Saccharimonadales bacterium]|nr:hypothetical protein [Candidatus Saccharimonadales bacterium]